jgi:hypothetical protein
MLSTVLSQREARASEIPGASAASAEAGDLRIWKRILFLDRQR